MKEKILIIEDEKKAAHALKVGLCEHNYNVQVVKDGYSGWDIFNNNSFDLVLLDVNLPYLNGFEVCTKIRAKTRQTPVIMITTLVTLEDKIKGYHAGADDYITKPFEFKELLMKINVLLKRSMEPATERNILQAADLIMDLNTKEVTRGNTSIQLTKKEFQLLQYFLQHKEKIISRQDIALNVWGIDFDTNTNIVDVYVNYLRNKIDKQFENKLIQTYAGRGYILKETC